MNIPASSNLSRKITRAAAHPLIASSGIVLLALALRLWGIGWGLPLKKAHIDESVVIFYTMRFFTGDLNPHIFFDYPTLQLYVNGFLFLVSFIAGKALGIFATLDQFAGIFLHGDASFLYLIARAASAVFGAASVYCTYLLGKRHFGGGGLPALMLAVVPVHVLHSHYATVDVSSVFFVLLSFLFIGRYYAGLHSRDLFIGSFVLGLAAAVKYYPFIFFLPLAVSVFIKEPAQRIKKAAIAAALTLAGFVVGCPYAALDFPAFSARFIDRFKLIVWGDHAATTVNASAGIPKIAANLAGSITLPLFLTALLGIIALFIFNREEKRREFVLWLGYPLTYILFLSTWKIASPHYLLPALPFLFLLGTAGFRSVPRLHPAFTSVLLALLCLIPLSRSIGMDMLLAREDTRLLSYRWMKANLPAGSRILRLPYTPEFSQIDPYSVQVDWDNHTLNTPVDILSPSYDYIICSSFNDEKSAWETSLLSRYVITNEWPYVPLAAFHHPRVTIYGKKM